MAPPPDTARILIVEDEAIVALDLGESVISLGYQLAGYATSAADALARADEVRPDLVLMDIRLGHSDGVYAARRLSESQGMPIVFVSGHAGELERLGAEGLGPVVAKPFSVEGLGRAIAAVLDARTRSRAAAAAD